MGLSSTHSQLGLGGKAYLGMVRWKSPWSYLFVSDMLYFNYLRKQSVLYSDSAINGVHAILAFNTYSSVYLERIRLHPKYTFFGQNVKKVLPWVEYISIYTYARRFYIFTAMKLWAWFWVLQFWNHNARRCFTDRSEFYLLSASTCSWTLIYGSWLYCVQCLYIVLDIGLDCVFIYRCLLQL